jgi:F-box and leucine-rich repeat protein 10/11
LNAYEKWSGSELQNHAWLGDMVDEVIKVELTTGNTMIIPTGWIHAVVRMLHSLQRTALIHIVWQHTPVDTLVFGGNFLHSYNISTRMYASSYVHGRC